MQADPKKVLTYTGYPLGVPGRPYPMAFSGHMDVAGRAAMASLPTATDDEDALPGRLQEHTLQLGVLEDQNNPLMVYTERPYNEMIGIAYREMPTPSMLPVFFDGLKQRDMKDPRKVQFYLGTAGAGKSYMARMTSEMRSKRGGLFVDCGGKNLQELLFETVLDVPESFSRELELRLAKGTLNPASISLLRTGLGTAFSEEDGHAAIDWHQIGSKEEGNKKQHLEEALKLLESVRKLEGLDLPQGNSLGLKTQKGALIRAWEEGREIILDEYNKCKPGTDSGLHDLWNLFTGSKDVHTVYGGAGQSFTFRRKDMKPGFFVTLTGNASRDGATTYELAASSYSRLRPDFIGDPTVEDWQHRICQLLTGLPVSTLYKSSPIHWNQNEEGFAHFLHEMRTLGMSEEEKAMVPDWQFSMLANWRKVIAATEKLARFYYQWGESLNPESDLLQRLPAVAAEVDPQYGKMVAVDLRMALRHIDKAKYLSPQVRHASTSLGYESPHAWSNAPVLNPVTPEPLEKSFGDRLSGIIRDEAHRTTIPLGKDNLYNHLTALATQHGLQEPNFMEARRNPNRESVAELLNINNPGVAKSNFVISRTRNQLCDWLRTVYPSLSRNNDDIFTNGALEQALHTAEAGQVLNEMSTKLTLASNDINTLGRAPVTTAMTYDTAVPNLEKRQTIVNVNQLVDEEQFLLSLAMPNVGSKNLDALWHPVFRKQAETDDITRRAKAYVDGSSQDGIAITSVACSRKAQDVRKHDVIHIIHSKEQQTTIIIGAEIPQGLSTFLHEQGILYISRKSPDAQVDMENALEQLIGNRSDTCKQAFLAAFKMRNRLTAKGKEILPVDINSDSFEDEVMDILTKDEGEEIATEGPRNNSDLIDKLAALFVTPSLTICSHPNYIANIAKKQDTGTPPPQQR